MNKLILLFLFLAVTFYTSAQTKYMIYFKDKGITSSTALQKSSSLYKIAEQSLDPRAIERRKQVMGENYITFEDLPVNQNYIEQLTSLNIKIENQLKWFNAVSAYLTDNQVNALNKLPFIEKIEPVKIFHYKNEPIIQGGSLSVPKGSLEKTTSLNYGGSFTENNLSDIPAVHDLGIKGTGVYVGILDDGFSYHTYNALKNLKVVHEHDYVHNLSTVSNQSGHGSSVFCLMAGYDPGNAIGPAYDAQFFLAETENSSSETHVEEDNYAAALQDMEAAGVQITSSSLGYAIFDAGQVSYTYADINGNTAICTQAANLAFTRGVLSFTASGNEGSYWGTGKGGIQTPADAFNIIAVGAVDSQNKMASFSSRGPTSDGRIKPEIVAMGQNNYIAQGGGSYSYGDGTSFATPIAAGIGALLKSCWPNLTNRQMRKIIIECGDDTLTPNNDRGWGLISAKRVIAYPNLDSVNNYYLLNKIFIDANGVNSSTVRLNYRVGSSSSFQTVAMNYDGTLKYNYTLPASNSGDIVEFYFTYQNNNGSLISEPSSKNYNFIYGNLLIGVIESNTRQTIPTQFSLMQNFPNPFNPSTVINYELPIGTHVTLKVYDILGREVATLVDEYQQAGKYNSQFSTLPTDRKVLNSKLSSSVYFYRLQAGDYMATKKMLLIK